MGGSQHDNDSSPHLSFNDLKQKEIEINTKGGLPKKTVFFGNFSQNGGGSPQFPKLLYNYQVIFGMPNSS